LDCERLIENHIKVKGSNPGNLNLGMGLYDEHRSLIIRSYNNGISEAVFSCLWR